jgi:glycosyltransferase involved in cell wall biosynthesis
MDAMTRGLMRAGHSVKVLTMATEKHPWLEAEMEPEYLAATDIEAVRIDTSLNRVDAFANILTGDSYNISRFHTPEFESVLTQVLQRQVFDLVIFESLFTAPYLPLVKRYCDGPLILRAHNVEHRIWELLAHETEAFSRRMYLRHLAERLKAYEVNALSDFDAVVAITEDDKRHFEALGCDSHLFTLPFGLDAHEFPPATAGPVNHVFHLGAMDWQPNVQGIQWFLDHVWPTVLKELPEAQLRLAGRKFGDSSSYARTNTTVLGEVADAWDVLAQPGIMVIPLLTGSGMRIKAIEAMAAGRPVVSTSLGMEGIHGTNGTHFFVADDANSFAQRIIDLHKNPSLAEAVGTEARAFVEHDFSNQALIDRIVGSIQRIFEL